MKRVILLILVCMMTFLLFSCSAGRYPYPTTDLSTETWRSQTAINPASWVINASSWFRAGAATQVEYANATAPYTEAISREAIRVPNIQNIKIIGDFQVQITGNPDNASVWIEGPNVAVRSIDVKVRDNSLCLEQLPKTPAGMMQRVIVHVTMKSINSLVHTGSGRVEGIRLFSNNLSVDASGTGNIFLAGHLNVRSVVDRGCGSVNIFTVSTTNTEIVSSGSGNVNITGKQVVCLTSIKHHGTSDINVVRATGQNIVIDAYGSGKVNVIGRVGIKEIRAADQACVFVPYSVSPSPCIYAYDDARVGIAGSAGTLNAYTTRKGRLLAKNLMVQSAFIQSSGSSHMNISGTNRVFATAKDYSTIYFYGNPDIVEVFQRNDGSVIFMNDGTAPPMPYKYVRQRRDTMDPGIRMSENYKRTRSNTNTYYED